MTRLEKLRGKKEQKDLRLQHLCASIREWHGIEKSTKTIKRTGFLRESNHLQHLISAEVANLNTHRTAMEEALASPKTRKEQLFSLKFQHTTVLGDRANRDPGTQ